MSSFGIVSVLPLSGAGARVPFFIEAKPPVSEDLRPDANYRIVSPGYFQAMAIPVIAGRVFPDAGASDAQPVAIINRQFARHRAKSRSPALLET